MNTKNCSNNVFIGMGGWDLLPFNRVFYPAKPHKGFRKLQYYSHFFDLVEINSTFYNSSFSPYQIQRWLDDVYENKRFIFTVKLFRGFTHTFDATKNDAIVVQRIFDSLRHAEKLGGIVIQFPSSFKRTNEHRGHIQKLRKLFPEDRLFLEVRHNSWNENPFYDFCQENDLHLVNVDLPSLPGHMPFNASSQNGFAYFRMMGRNAEAWKQANSSERYLYLYSNEELQELINKIKQTSIETAYVVFHNDLQAFSLVNGCQVEHALHPKNNLSIPANLLLTYPQLKSFCKPYSSDHDLFRDNSF